MEQREMEVASMGCRERIERRGGETKLDSRREYNARATPSVKSNGSIENGNTLACGLIRQM
jgi:hypothetical protein